ncbi:hypothetical protein FIBSPDRAFT_735869 [Athelia psychrophila]|uniref:RING-type domain-containing protein n=1 Tax=Athelia psychrophila TaxID=1759441 RepID=A0A166MZ04_9AGAM|nr:hypothetical protein FIBSPDRAFT_735869 [Fibularhizoctonia sp. CBS 109695]
MVQCGICLELLKQPVVIPCGHLHCERCLTSHIKAGHDAMHSTCPTCRAKFNVASLDLRYVPKKYHEFIKPSVQRVWIEIPSQDGFKSRISELEKRLDVVHRDKQLLLEKCEQNLDAIKHHAEGERNARTEAEKAKTEASHLKKQLALLKVQQKRRRTMDDETL